MNIECDNYVYWIRLIHISLVHARTQHLTPIKTDKTNRFQFGFGKATFSVKPNELYALCVMTGKYFERLVLLNTVFHFISLVLPLPSNRYTAESSTIMCSHEQNFNEWTNVCCETCAVLPMYVSWFMHKTWANSFSNSCDGDLLCVRAKNSHISISISIIVEHCLNTFIWNMFAISRHIVYKIQRYALQCIYTWDKNTNVIKHLNDVTECNTLILSVALLAHREIWVNGKTLTRPI